MIQQSPIWNKISGDGKLIINYFDNQTIVWMTFQVEFAAFLWFTFVNLTCFGFGLLIEKISDLKDGTLSTRRPR